MEPARLTSAELVNALVGDSQQALRPLRIRHWVVQGCWLLPVLLCSCSLPPPPPTPPTPPVFSRCCFPLLPLARLATSVCQLRHNQMEQGPTEPHTGRSTFLLSSGDAGGRYC